MAYVKSSLIPQGILDMIAINNAEEGAICSFNTDLSMGMYECICQINASGGNGTPSTPIPIVGHSELNLVRCGVNLWDEEWKLRTIGGLEYLANKYPIPVQPNTTYYICTPYSTSIDSVDENDTYKSFIGNRTNATFTTPADCHYIRFAIATSSYGNVYQNDISINYPATDTAYHAYNGTSYLVSFGQTVYGGEYDANAGKVTLTWGTLNIGDHNWLRATSSGTVDYFYIANNELADLNIKTETFPTSLNLLCSIFETKSNNNSIASALNSDNTMCRNQTNICIRCDTYSTPESFKSGMNGVIVAYELATPIEIDVSELSVDTIVGVNNMFHDCNGTTKGKFFETVGHNVLK